MTTNSVRTSLLALVMLASASIASAQSLVIPQTIFWSGVSADAVSTYHNLSNGAQEVNPILAPIGSPAGITATVAGSSLALWWLTHHFVAPVHPKAAAVIYSLVGGVHLGVGIHNFATWQPDPIARSRTLGPAVVVR